MSEPSQAAFALTEASLVIRGRTILDRLTWSVAAGARAAVLGANGSGKSTLLRLLCGYWFPTTGVLSVLGRKLGKVNLDDLRRRIGVVDPAGPFVPDPRLTVQEVVLSGFFGHLCVDFDNPTSEERHGAAQAAAEVGLESRLNQRWATLSTGEQRRALLARALVARPSLLLLDEPTAGLDLLARETMLATVDQLARRRPEMTSVIVTHHLEELLPQTTAIALLHGGRLMAHGPPENVLTADCLSAAFGCPVEVHSTAGRWHWSVTPNVWRRLLANSD